MTYNFTLLENSTGLVDVMQVTNSFTDGLLGIFLLIFVTATIYVTLRSSLNNEHAPSAIMATMFAGMILSFLLRTMGLVGGYVVSAMIVLTIGSVAALANRER